MNKLKQLIRETLNNYLKEDKCGCGCNDCNKAPILTENLKGKLLISEGLKYHIDNKKPLYENIYRAGSKKYFDLWKEARALYEQNLIQVNDTDKELLTQTRVGEFGIYEGKLVPLDFPIIEGEEDILNYDVLDDYFPSYELNEAKKKAKKKNPPLNKPKRGGSKKFYVYVRDPKTKNIKKVSFGDTGLSTKVNDPKARRAFAKRHKCAQKTDRTTPGYWSCRIGRYWKQLGGAKNFSGYW